MLKETQSINNLLDDIDSLRAHLDAIRAEVAALADEFNKKQTQIEIDQEREYIDWLEKNI